MKLRRIRIEQLRRFGQPFELRDLEAGLNLFSGPNEAGKSTVVRAIRAAFFERYRTSDVLDLVPHGDSAAAPSVELDFEIGGKAYSLRKVWLKKNRCELDAAGQQLDGEEAEAHLARLLGFGFGKKGASRAEHWGVPGLLWIEQGSGQNLQEAVGHAAGHLRGALDQSASEVASTQGDAVIARVQAMRGELLTEAKGAPRGEYAGTIAEKNRLAPEIERLDREIASYRQQVDELTLLAAEHAAEQAGKPWEALRAKQAEAEARLRSAEKLAAELRSDEQMHEQLGQQIMLVQGQLAGLDDRQRSLQSRQQALALAEGEAGAASAACKVWADRQRQSEQALEQAERDLAAAQTEDLRRQLDQQCRDAEKQGELLGNTLAAAEQEAAALNAARDAEAQTSLARSALDALRERHGTLRELQIRREAAQTRIEFALDANPGTPVTLDGAALEGAGQRSITAAATLLVAGVGSITILPGRTDAAELAREEAAQQAAQQADFQRLGIASLEDAEARHLRHAQAQADAARAGKALKQLAPKGLDALRDERAAQQRRQADAVQKSNALPPRTHDAAALSLPDARSRRDAARTTLASVAAHAQRAQQDLSGATAKAEVARAEHRALSDEIASPEHRQRRADATSKLDALRAAQLALSSRIEQRRREVEPAQHEALAQDVERLARSAAHAHMRFLERDRRIAQLRGQLEAVGAQGLEERRATLAAQLEQTLRRHDELKLRADALSMLHELLTRQRREATQRLQAPLQKHLSRYLQLLFAGAQIELADDLMPAVLSRATTGGAAGCGSSPIDALSFGAREQMGVLSRLAYADLLKEAGRPTLIILDDALVHSDEQRLAQMKRVLYDAARRHQILLFTCHPAAWVDSGAPSWAIARG